MATKPQANIAIIGGSGLYQMEGLQQIREVRLSTPYGRPSDAIMVGMLGNHRVAFLSRHGRGHRITPTSINYRANLYALKCLGVTQIFSVSAVGSMKEPIQPGHLVLPDQFIDRTTRRVGTFFDQGIAAHVAFSDPICPTLSAILWNASQGMGTRVHRPGTYLCIEGPQFSTRAESHLYRQWGVDIIGMTNLPEAKLAREAEICYATLALVTDYDCWHETEEAVSVGAILSIMQKNVTVAKRVLRRALELAQVSTSCACQSALEYAMVTTPSAMTAPIKKRYDVFIKKYSKKTSPKRKRR